MQVFCYVNITHVTKKLNYICNFFSVKLMDVDKRFSVYKDDFICYDFNEPLPPHIRDQWENHFDIVILDPPFLSEDCFLKCALTAKFLTKNKILICTGTNCTSSTYVIVFDST